LRLLNEEGFGAVSQADFIFNHGLTIREKLTNLKEYFA
jgi:hypothetical protein